MSTIRKNKYLIILYFIFAAINIVAKFYQIKWLMLLSKALLMPLLLSYYFNRIRFKLTKFNRLIITALFFAWAGDIMNEFMFVNQTLFIFGLSSFVFTIVFYTFAFISPLQRRNYVRSKPWLAAIFIFYGVVFIWIIYPKLGRLAFPVIIYASVLLFLVITVLNRIVFVSRKSFKYVLYGALLFLFSNSFIAINKFRFTYTLSPLFIISTYALAQYLIVEGCILQEKNKTENL